MNDGAYDPNNYSEEEMLEILGFEPSRIQEESITAEEIEEKIIQELQNYQSSRTVSGRKMLKFLKEMYEYFFDLYNSNETETNKNDQKDEFVYSPKILEDNNFDEENLSMNRENNNSFSETIESYIEVDPSTNRQVLSNTGIELLGFSTASPTQNEIEAKILQLMEGHSEMDSDYNRKAFSLYRELYTILFSNDPDEELSDSPENEDAAPPVEETSPPVQYNKTLEYTPGVVNPILKETFKRIISVDSQFREEVYPQSTDFTLNFTETLRDVVSMKLYAVQIPITWYTISRNYGSNFFYLKPTNTTTNYGIYNNPNHEYKMEINPGNYTPTTLSTEIKSKLENLGSIYTDVSFGSTTYNYGDSNAHGTLTIDIQKVYQEQAYEMDISGTELQKVLNKSNGIPLNSVKSSLYSVSYESIQNTTYIVDENNNTIIIRQYLSSSSIAGPYESSVNTLTIEDIPISIEVGQSRTVNEIYLELKSKLETNPKLSNSTIRIETLDESSFQYNWTIELNRYNASNVPNSKVVIIFPPVNDDINNVSEGIDDEVKTLWIKNDIPSAFNMKTFQEETNSIIFPVSSNAFETSIVPDNESIIFKPKIDTNGGVYISDSLNKHENDIIIRVPNQVYTSVTELITAIRTEMNKESLLSSSKIEYNEIDNEVLFRMNINKVYTSVDYRLVFYDVSSFTKCTNASKSYRNATADTTLGFILGFKDLTEYDLHPENVSDSSMYINPDTLQETNSEYSITTSELYRNRISLRGGSVVNIYLYNYFMIILDDFNQNHINDGLVTVASEDTSVTLPHYATRKNYRGCTNPSEVNPSSTSSITNEKGLTQNQVYSVEQIIEAQNKQLSRMSQGPFVKDMFALLPVKATSSPGTTYVEFGGTLQQQERIYFGPVNIRRISIKLVNDKGDVVDLNGNNWSFQLVCEQLYRR